MGHQGQLAEVAVVSFQARQSSTGRFRKPNKPPTAAPDMVCDHFIQGSVSQRAATRCGTQTVTRVRHSK